MKKITLWLFALFTCWQMTAQTGTVVVGVDDGTPNTTTGYPSPLQDYYKTGRAQYLYRASELSAAGLAAGPITEIGWVATNLGLSTLEEGYQISMKSTATTALTTTFEAGATLVYGPTDFTPSSTGNVMFTLATPFIWDGTSNVIVEVCAGLSTGGFTENVQCSNSTLTFNGSNYFRSDTSGTPCTTATGTTSTSRPLLVAVGNVASCLAPLNLVSANITAYTADVSWDASTSGSAVGYEYVVSTSNVAPAGSGIATTNLFASISSLAPQTTYYLFVRTNCGATFSGWNGPISFTTACAPVTTFPVLEPFTTFLPNACWERGDGGDTTAGPATFGTNGFYADGFGNVTTTGSFAYNIWLASANDWIISPQYTIPAVGYELKFDAAATNYGATSAVTNWESDDMVEVLVSTTGTTNWTVLHTYNDSNVPSNTGTANVIDLDAYSGQTVRFAYRVVEGATDGPADLEFFVDNFQIRMSPTCPDQTGLTVGTITSTTADFSWDDLSGSGALGYEYAVTTSVTPPASGTATTGTIYSATSLLPQTTYYLHVRSSCAAGSFGNWATISFVTNCASVTSFIQNFDTVTTPAFPTCWAKVGAGGTANTQVGSANSAPNTMYFASFTTTSLAVVSMQQVSNLGAGTNRIKFDMRANFTVGGVVEFGYLTNPTDATTFVPFTTFTASSLAYATFQYSPPAGTYSDYPAFRHTGSPGNSLLIDNVIWEANPACADQTGVVFAAVTSSGADTSWDTITGAAGYEYAVTTSATPPASGTATTNTFYIATGLAPQTLYYIHVRPMCSPGVYGNWASNSFTTACVAITTLPWNEGFEGLTTVGANNFPTCWFKENGDWSSQNTNGTYSTANTGTNYIRNSWSATNEYVWTPGFDLVAGTSYDFSSFVQGDNGTGWVVDYFVNSSQVSTGATQLGGSYNVPGTGTPYAFQPYAQVTRSFVPATSGTYYFAVRVNQPSGSPWYVSFDDFKLELSPACPTPSPSAGSVTDASANLTWASVPSATLGYEYVLDNVATDPAGSGTPTASTSYAASGLTQSTTYYFHIRSVCSAGTYSTWSTVSFTTLATPPVNDNCAGALVLTPGALYTSNPVATSNVGATNSNPPAPGCASFLGGDVWFTVTVPASGNISIETITGTVTDTGLAVYSGTCAGLTLVDCDDDSALNAGSNSLIELIGRTPGEVLYVNAWDYSNNNFGTFSVTAYDASLSAASFDTSNFVAYPNPVKDVLNLSYKTTISNVRVVNLLGQEVLNTKANTNDVQVDMSALTAGAYIVSITVDDTVHTIKVIKE